MNLFFLIAITLIVLSHHHVYGLPTLKTALSASENNQDLDVNSKMMILEEAIKTPLNFLKGGVDQANDDSSGDSDDNPDTDVDDDTSSSSSVSIRIDSKDSYCLFLPPKPGLDVAATETEGTPFCTQQSGNHQYPKLPSGLILSSHYESTENYVQVTGKMNADAYSLGAQDGGGQYDNRDVPGVKCNGYKYFVSLLEPDVNQYCIRCCKYESDCPVGKSGYGCNSIIDNGTYN